MDPVTMIYYATVCAVLSVGAGTMRTMKWRLLIGALVGVAAAAVLPSVRAAIGF